MQRRFLQGETFCKSLLYQFHSEVFFSWLEYGAWIAKKMEANDRLALFVVVSVYLVHTYAYLFQILVQNINKKYSSRTTDCGRWFPHFSNFHTFNRYPRKEMKSTSLTYQRKIVPLKVLGILG